MFRIATTVVCSGLLLSLSTGPAGADSPHPWSPYQGTGYTVPGGEACDFQLTSRTISDKERYRVVETHPDGSTKREEWTGQLVVEFRNDETGAAVRRNLTGRGDFIYGLDGSWSLINVGGHFAAVLREGSDPGPGVYVVTGEGFAVSSDAEGHRVLDLSGHGKVENVCETLAAG